MFSLILLVVGLLWLQPALGVAVSWIADSVSLTFGSIDFVGPTSNTTTDASGWKLSVEGVSNGPIHKSDSGHFQLKFYVTTVDYGILVGTSVCIPLGLKQTEVTTMLESTVLTGSSGSNTHLYTLSQMMTVKAKKFREERSTIDVTNSYEFVLDGSIVGQEIDFTAFMLTTSCETPRTVGNWEDVNRWSTGVVPTSADDVTITAGSGVIRLNSDVTVSSLTTLGGLILAYESSCPDDWESNPTNNPSTKCYKRFDTMQNFDDAETTCRTSAYGSMDSHLVQISNAEELLVVQRLCRGQTGTITTVKGCWIGLSDPGGLGKYSWIQPETVRSNSFRDWRRYEYNNHTFSEGLGTNGELCVQMVPWQADALIKEQGSFNDVACKLEKPFVCQIFSKTVRRKITVSGITTLSGGGMTGGEMDLLGTAYMNNFYAWKSSFIRLGPSATGSTLTNLYMEQGSTLSLEASVSSSQTSYVGEILNLDVNMTAPLQMQSYFIMASGTTWTITGNVSINARANIEAIVSVAADINFNLNQGGSLSRSTYTLTGASTYLNLGGGSQMSTYDAYELKTQHRGEVIGEYSNNIANEIAEPTTGKFLISGVFKLKLSGGATAITPEITECIPYHSTAAELAEIIGALPTVQNRGGVTVRRYGSGEDPLFGYGYTYRIEMDAPPTTAFAEGALDLEVHCYGIPDCGCSETKVPLTDPSGQKMCHRKEGNSSRVDGNACVTPPVIAMSRVTYLSYTATYGLGSIIIGDGTHRLPPISNVLISSASTGLGIVGADEINWGGIAVDGVGTIICAGTGWANWDSASVIFGPAWWDIRGYVHMLETAPAFNMQVDVFVLSGLGSVLTASPHSNMTWSSGTWNGGTVGGRSRLNILGNVQAGGTNKALRYGITMFVQEAATFTWTSGNISLANGASIIVEGTFDMQTTGDRKFIGEAHLLSAAEPEYIAMLKQEPDMQWHGYFGLEIPTELRGGFYRNPLCGDQCTRENYMWFRQNGNFSFSALSNTSFNLPVNLLGSSRMRMGSQSYVEMASGGICGNDVVVDIASGTTYTFSGGQMSMRATCKIQGEGELLIAGGAHDMSFSIDAHITIAGGIMIWPFSRGPGLSITFNGGLLIEKKGRLQIEPYSTNIVVYGEVILKDECMLQFPMIGTAAQPTNSDKPDAPDPSPRGSVTAVNLLTWLGGTMRGKADFISEGTLTISGGLKQIRSMAKLVNKGLATWDHGDILMADNADFMNLGTVQMTNGSLYFDANNLYQGTIIPTESGGDVFALNFHSYDLDSGWLSYLDYVNLRTQVVSRAPVGWTEADQDLTLQTPLNIV